MKSINMWFYERLEWETYYFIFYKLPDKLIGGYLWRIREWFGSRRFYKTIEDTKRQGMPTWYDWNQHDYILKRQQRHRKGMMLE